MTNEYVEFSTDPETSPQVALPIIQIWFPDAEIQDHGYGFIATWPHQFVRVLEEEGYVEMQLTTRDCSVMVYAEMS